MADYNAWQDRAATERQRAYPAPAGALTTESVLTEAARITATDRQQTHGAARENHERIAALWSPILGVEVTPQQAALCMIQVKVSRLLNTPDHRDSVVDIAGYASVYAEIVGL
jgi:hypothetical protein